MELVGNFDILRSRKLMIQRSMSPACTLLKIRYDACFNSWFEGYLQPALDASRAARSHVPLNDTPAIPVLSKPVPTAAPRLVTSWAAAFRPRDSRTVANRTAHHPLIQTLNPGNRIWQPIEEAATDVTGKTRAQIKAEEYDRACGEPWQRYQLCLTVGYTLLAL